MTKTYKILTGVHLGKSKYRKLIHGRDIGFGGLSEQFHCDLHLSFDHMKTTITLKKLESCQGYIPGNCKE